MCVCVCACSCLCALLHENRKRATRAQHNETARTHDALQATLRISILNTATVVCECVASPAATSGQAANAPPTNDDARRRRAQSRYTAYRPARFALASESSACASTTYRESISRCTNARACFVHSTYTHTHVVRTTSAHTRDVNDDAARRRRGRRQRVVSASFTNCMPFVNNDHDAVDD